MNQTNKTRFAEVIKTLTEIYNELDCVSQTVLDSRLENILNDMETLAGAVLAEAEGVDLEDDVQ